MNAFLSWNDWPGLLIFLWLILCTALGALLARTIDQVQSYLATRVKKSGQ